MSALFCIPYWSNPSLMEQSSSVHSLLIVLRKETFMMHGNLLHATVKIGVLIFKVLILIGPTVQCHILPPSESILLSWICIYSLPVFWMPVIYSIIQMFPHMKESVSVHYHIIWNGLKILPQCSSQLIWRSILSSMHECNSRNKTIWKKCNQLLDSVFKIIKYNKSTIHHAIYIKVLSDGKVSYLTVSTDDVIKTTKNDIEFPELRMFLKNPLILKSNKDISVCT